MSALELFEKNGYRGVRQTYPDGTVIEEASNGLTSYEKTYYPPPNNDRLKKEVINYLDVRDGAEKKTETHDYWPTGRRQRKEIVKVSGSREISEYHPNGNMSRFSVIGMNGQSVVDSRFDETGSPIQPPPASQETPGPSRRAGQMVRRVVERILPAAWLR